MIDFFENRLEYGPYEVFLKRSKALVTWKVSERWKDIGGITVKCGAKGSEVITRRVGVSQKHVETLENSIGASIGPKGIAQIKSSVKETRGHEVSWDLYEERTRTVEFTAPECGYRSETIYQLEREYQINYQKKRLFTTERWSRLIQEDTNHFHSTPFISEYEESCKCKKGEDKAADGFLKLTGKNSSFLVPFSRTDNGVVLHFENNSFEMSNVFLDEGFEITIDEQYLNQTQRFIEDSQIPFLNLNARIYSEDDRDDEMKTIEKKPELVLS